MDQPVILIGPSGAGKSTLGPLLAQRLGVDHVELDDLRWDYYKEIGYDHALAGRLRREQGSGAMFRYWKQFDPHAVERVLADHPAGVISFGAGHTVYDDETLFERVQRALAPYAHVILLLPGPNEDETIAILTERFWEVARAEGFTPQPDTLESIGYLVRHPANRRLAKRVVYTNGMTPEETCEEILKMIGARGVP
jgi:adenylate kinase family enzyme